MAGTRPTRRRSAEPAGVAGDAPLSALLAPVHLSRAVAARLEARMKQQVRAAVDAQAAQQRSLALGGSLDGPWRAVGAVGCLRAFKKRGRDPEAGELRWPTTERSAADEGTIDEETAVGRAAAAGRVFASAAGAAGVYRGRPHARSNAYTAGGERDELDMQAFRAFGRVQGSFRDIVGAHYAANSAEFLQQQRLFSPYVTDAVVLRSIRASKDSYLGVKWVCEAAPSSIALRRGGIINSSSKRDLCYLEMVGFTTDVHGRELGFVAVASIETPECPPFPEFLRVARIRMQRTMLIRATDASLAASELFIMGESDDARIASSLAINSRLRMHVAVLNDVSLVIDSQNLVKQTLIEPRPWVPDDSRDACSVCSRGFHFLKRRRHHCRLCGELVCKSCYVMRNVPRAGFACAATANVADNAALPIPVPARARPRRAATDNDQRRQEDQREVGATKFCVRCVMGLRATDNRLEAFAQEISKLMSVSNLSFLLNEDIEASGVSTASSTSNLSRGRGSSITYFKRGSIETREFNLDDLFEDHVKASRSDDGHDSTITEAHDDTFKTGGGRIGTTDNTIEPATAKSTAKIAMEKKLRPVSESPRPLAREKNNNSSYSSQGKLVRLSTLSRSSSSSRLLAELYDRGSVTVA